ncbi:MAG: hemolysin family protein [Rhodospirillaceae bacterium]
MSEPARPLAADTVVHGPGLFTKLKRWLAPEIAEAETVREVIEELIEERSEDRPEGEPAIDPNERLLLANVLKLRGITAADIMVPRADIVAVEASTPVTEALALVVKEGHSRLPVYRETLDDVAGLIHIKDLAILAADQITGENGERVSAHVLTDLLRPVLFVSPAVRVLDLLLEMRLKRAHMAMVVDEYGGIDGVVTIEDVVEQIVGEIEDEHDLDQTPELIPQPDGTMLADGRVALTDFEARVGSVFSEEERETNNTLGGLVASLAGRMPSRGELVKHSSGIEFEVTDSDPRLVRRLRIRNLPPPKPEA